MPAHRLLLAPLLLALLAPVAARAASEPLVLVPSAQLGAGPARENSGIVASRRHAGLYWMINDSGDEPRVYPVRRDGSVATPERYEAPGVLVGGAINVDWEDIALDASGRLLVPDFGNNGNDRRDLVIYVLDEPRPEAGRTTWRERWFFRYPEQTAFPAPPEDFDYDAEALFTVGDRAYVLTKHRSDDATTLYALVEPHADRVNTLVRLGEFDVGGRVTAADATADGLRLVVATYDTLWLFERDDPAQSFFDGRVSRLAFEAPQVEAVCFGDASGSWLLLADEEAAALYEVPLDRFRPVTAAAPETR
ncbi:MAG: hypothetical protein V2J02_00320 [Pseudomonadales bacterium]|nr:hypothetical protein [Pseudomonadales bacterium]